MPSPHTVFAHPAAAAPTPTPTPPPGVVVSASAPFVGLPPSGPPPSAPPPPIPPGAVAAAAAAQRRASTPGSHRSSANSYDSSSSSPQNLFTNIVPGAATASSGGGGGPQTALAVGGRLLSGVSANASARASASSDASAAATRASTAAPNPNLRTAAAKPYLGLQQQNSQPYFHAGQLPRTSSLLPPPNLISSDQSHRHIPSTTTTAAAAPPPRPSYQNYYQQQQQPHQVLFQNPFNAQPIAPGGSDQDEPFLAHQPPQSRSSPQPKRNHSRSSSTTGLSDSFRNLNRWSISTSSSRASISFGGRRQSSIDPFGVQAQSAPIPQLSQAQFQQEFQPLGAYNSPPRKLQKQRPSISNGSTSGSRVRRLSPSPTPVPPLESLPPIVSLPSLEQEVSSGTIPSSDRPHSALDDARRSRNDSLLVADPTHDPRDQSLHPGDGNHRRSHARTSSDATMTMYDRNGSTQSQARDHPRNRSHAAKGSTDTTASSKSKDRSSKQPSQKAMLSRALEKANSAVQLDNARNFEGARQAYSEACDLLHQVLMRTNGEEDKKKLEAISKTYTARIEELDDILPDQVQLNKALPSRPTRNGQRDELSVYSPGDSDDDAPVRTTTFSQSSSSYRDRDSHPSPGYVVPTSSHRRQPSGGAVSNTSAANSRYGSLSAQGGPPVLQSAFSQPFRKDSNTLDVSMRPMDSQYMPPPLSPRRLPSGSQSAGTSPGFMARNDLSMASSRLNPPEHSTFTRGHSRGNSHESVSWLDPIDESGSNASSMQSRSSSMGVHRKRLRNTSGDTEAEFDAALDDAIEAAYDEGYDVDVASLRQYPDDGEDIVARAMKKVELAKERVRESEREALQLANDREKRLREQLRLEDEEEPEDFFDDGDDSEDEERLLEEMTRGYAIEDFSFGTQPPRMQGMPRTSDSSEFTARTWQTSSGSNPPTATTVLTTVSENAGLAGVAKASAPLAPPPTQALPQLPPQRPGSSGVQSSGSNNENKPNADQSVRSRRLSGQNPKQLKIETTQLRKKPSGSLQPVIAGNQHSANTPPMPQQPAQPPLPKPAGFIAQQRQALSAGAGRTAPFKQAASPLLPIEQFQPPTPPLPQGVAAELEPRPGSPSVAKPPPVLRKNFSSSSLRSMKGRNVSVANFDDASDMSPSTPLSTQFGPPGTRLPAVPNLPTPVGSVFKDRLATRSTGVMFLFDADIHGPASPGSLNSVHVDAPLPLEPCPTDTLLRPFWLMRCLYQTLAHPRGGYISNKLFIPREVWGVKGVKLKNVEDKTSNCDFLTAALQKLSKVDTIDADAVLEEMQSLEGALEQVQATLTRKLGNEVGVQSMGSLFRDATGGADGDPGSAVPRSSSVSGKSSFSWRRLRSKNSSAGLGNSYAGGGNKKEASPSLFEGAKDGGAPMASLPMTAHPTSKPSKRNVTSVEFKGPNANYMSSLARLFDAAQVIDQIARQVEDPGLRHADKTQVGLELCTRHAAEFFAFYICRFVLTDLTLLLDKFVKRGSEWALV